MYVLGERPNIAENTLCRPVAPADACATSCFSCCAAHIGAIYHHVLSGENMTNFYVNAVANTYTHGKEGYNE